MPLSDSGTSGRISTEYFHSSPSYLSPSSHLLLMLLPAEEYHAPVTEKWTLYVGYALTRTVRAARPLLCFS